MNNKDLNKYLSVFKISFQQEFAYKFNFIMWRVRNLMQIFLVFFLWDAIFADPNREVFGYDRAKILAYVFGLFVVKAFVFSSRSQDIAGEIARGDLTNYLLKPLSYFKYWLTRDLSSKALNIIFASIEALVLIFLMKPDLFVQSNIFLWVFAAVALMISVLLFFVVSLTASLGAFWFPESVWAIHFFVVAVIANFLSGGTFPLDVLPDFLQDILYLTPFPYLVFFPIQIYLGKLKTIAIIRGIAISIIWLTGLIFLFRKVWHKGLVEYRAEGR